MDIKRKRALLHIFFPNRCPVCGEVIGAQERFCGECPGKLTAYEGSGSPKYTDSFTACYVYDENVIPAIRLLKNGICGNADYALGLALADRLRENGVAGKCDILVPVPMSVRDKRRRSYNQSELLCRIISSELGIPVCASAVSKSRRTAPQKELGRSLRRVNLKNAFNASPELVSGKRVLIIDDICTTGSTLSEVARTLKEAGAAEVHSACCCKTVNKKK